MLSPQLSISVADVDNGSRRRSQCRRLQSERCVLTATPMWRYDPEDDKTFFDVSDDFSAGPPRQQLGIPVV